MKGRVARNMMTYFQAAYTQSFCLLFAVVTAQVALAQDLLVLKANSTSVDVQDGDRLLKGDWTIDPVIALDVYDVRTTAEKRVTFITDIDSMSFDVQPGHTYDFIILLNGKDECRTRISTMTQSYTRVVPAPSTGPDTIPISIRHGKLHLSGMINDSEVLDLIFDTGAQISALYPSAMRRGAKLQFDGTTNNMGTGGTTLRETSSDNRLEIAGLRWNHEPVMYLETQADRADGIVGYPVFEGKVVEFDYDRMVMIVHDTLPAHAAGFAKTAMPFVGALTAVEAALVFGEREASGLFVLDTGGTGAMNVNQAFAAAHGLRGAMQELGESTSRGTGSGRVRNQIALLPELRLAGFTLRDVPIHVELPSEGNAIPPGGTLNMEVLGRFNTLLDYSRHEAYFRPNAHFNGPFKARFHGPPWFVVVGIVGFSIASLAGLSLLMAKRRRSELEIKAFGA